MYSTNKYCSEDKKMLRKFRVTNFKNFEQPVELDFTKVSDYKFDEDCITSNRLLKNIIIYGPNGSGKSNFGLALFDIVLTLTDRHLEPFQFDDQTFLNFNTTANYATFEYEFGFGSDIIKYSYKKSSTQAINHETLSINNQEVYKIDYEKRHISATLDYIDLHNFNLNNFKWDIPFVRYLSGSASIGDDSVIRKMIDFVDRMLWFRSLKDNAYIGLRTDLVWIPQWIMDNNKVGEFESFLRDIAGLDMHLQVAEMPATNQKFLLQKGKSKSVNFESVMSTGTQSLIVLFYWKQFLDSASFVFVDEFDAFYHFELSENVVKMFKAIPNLQIVLTSHNTHLSSNDLTRPDCCWLLKNGKLKSLKERTDRELREGHSIEKLLRSGEFDD